MTDLKDDAGAVPANDNRGRRELTFAGPDLQPVERWLAQTAVTAGLSIERGEIHETTDSYLDTGDGRLLRLGFCLRLIEGNGPAVVALEPVASVADPGNGWRESLVPGTALSPEQHDRLFGGRLRYLKGDRSLNRRIAVRSHLQSLTLRRVGGAECEMTVDEMDVSLAESDRHLTGAFPKAAFTLHQPRPERESARGTGVPAHPELVEARTVSPSQRVAKAVRLSLRPQPADGAGAQRLVAELQASCPLRRSTATRFHVAVAALDLGTPGPPELGPDRIERSQTVAEAAYAVLRRHFRRMLAEEAGTRLGDDSEALHDMRVAIRRQRAALRLFRDGLPPRVTRLRARLKRVASALGEVRDLDVHLATLEECKGDLSPEDRAALEVLRERLRHGRDVARRKMLRTLDAPRYARLVESVTELLRTEPSRRFAPGRSPICLQAPELITKRYGRVMKLARKIDANSSAHDYHRLRIRCKALRYALEFHADLYGKPAQRMIRDLVKLQDLLGEHQDANVAASWLRGLIGDRRSRLAAPTAFVAGRRAGRYEQRARRLRRKFPKRLRAITGRSWSRLQETMQLEAVAAAVTLRHPPGREHRGTEGREANAVGRKAPASRRRTRDGRDP